MKNPVSMFLTLSLIAVIAAPAFADPRDEDVAAAIAELKSAETQVTQLQQQTNAHAETLRLTIRRIQERLRNGRTTPAEGFFQGSAAVAETAWPQQYCGEAGLAREGKVKEAYARAVARGNEECKIRFPACAAMSSRTTYSFAPLANIPTLVTCTINVVVRGSN